MASWADAGMVVVEIAKQRAAIAANIVRPNLASLAVTTSAGLTSMLVLFMTFSVFILGITAVYITRDESCSLLAKRYVTDCKWLVSVLLPGTDREFTRYRGRQWEIHLQTNFVAALSTIAGISAGFIS